MVENLRLVFGSFLGYSIVLVLWRRGLSSMHARISCVNRFAIWDRI